MYTAITSAFLHLDFVSLQCWSENCFYFLQTKRLYLTNTYLL